MSVSAKIRIQPYTDAFDMACQWPIGMKYGDGSEIYCEQSAIARIIFESDGRVMLCRVHTQEIANQRPQDVVREGKTDAE